MIKTLSGKYGHYVYYNSKMYYFRKRTGSFRISQFSLRFLESGSVRLDFDVVPPISPIVTLMKLRGYI